jgi:hypothetical protein
MFKKLFAVVFAMLIVLTMFMPNAMALRGWQGTSGSPELFFVEVEKGNIPGHSIVHKFGHGNVGGSMAPLTISGVYKTPMAVVSLEIVSDDTDDALDSVGAFEYTVIGIDANYDEITQVIAAHATDGLVAVAIPIDMLRVYRWYVSASGVYAGASVGSHEGVLTMRVAGAGATWSQIEDTPFPAGQSEIGAYTVPDGFRAYIIQQELHGDSAKSVDVVLFRRSGIDIVIAPFTVMTTMSHYVGVKGINATDFKAPMDDLPARTDIGYMATVASGTADVSVHFSILLVKDGY